MTTTRINVLKNHVKDKSRTFGELRTKRIPARFVFDATSELKITKFHGQF